ncbi:hypothetical protein [Pseudogemmobacter sonorensis]|uniref:hypothetical protein n=1 Tax=Pseudogemmobacter sonorensis TaxID=2989681 RepID=UPI00368827CF
MRAIHAAFLLLGLAACVEQPQSWTREDQARYTTRQFRGHSSAQIIAAAEKVLRLADPKDVKFEYESDGFLARRSVLAYYVIAAATGNYIFDFSVKGSTAELKIYSNISGVGPYTTIDTGGNTVPGIATTPGQQSLSQSAAEYDLFFSRLSYLLGESETWVGCNDVKTAYGLPRGRFEAMCLNADDNTP